MPTVLVTRPQDDSQRLAARLTADGFDPFVEPLLTLIPSVAPRPVAGGVRAVMITSQHAFIGLGERKAGIADLLRRPVFCVGEQTAEAARAFGFQDVLAAGGDGAALAALIRDMMPPSAEVILHIGGADIAGHAGEILRSSGYTVRHWAVYKAEAAQSLSPELKDRMEKQSLAAALFFSPRTAAVFGALARESALEACCKELTAIGLSEAVAAPLRMMPFGRVLVASVPTEDAMVTTLREAFETD